MDKQKQIEEMAKIISCDCSIKTMRQCEGFDSCSMCRANDLYNAGYRKIHEGTVVLTIPEKERLLRSALSFDQTTMECLAKEIRKEAAEKFAELVKMAFYYHFDELIPSIMADKIDEICKEITEGNYEKTN